MACTTLPSLTLHRAMKVAVVATRIAMSECRRLSLAFSTASLTVSARSLMAAILTGMRRTVYLARHGETDWNRAGRWQGHTDVALNDQGRVQGHLMAAALRSRGIVQVGSS